MSQLHSIEETTKILTNLDSRERKPSQESLMVTVATTITKNLSHLDTEMVDEDEDDPERVNQLYDREERSSDYASSDQLTEYDYCDDEVEVEEMEEKSRTTTNDSEEGRKRSELYSRGVSCDCEICTSHRLNSSQGKSICFRESNALMQDKSVSTIVPAVTEASTQRAITQYRPFVSQSPFNFGMEYMARSVDACPQEVKGQLIGDPLPSWLNGTLIRIGPGKWDLKIKGASGDGTFTMNNWLDGCAIMTKYRINDGSVYFSSRFLESDAYKKMVAHGKPIYTEFGTRAYPDPDKGFFSRLVNTIVPSDLTDNDISNIYQVSDKVYTATESCNLWQVDLETLDSTCKINLDKLIKLSICSSHPHYSPSEGLLYNVGCTFLTGMKYHVLRMPVEPAQASTGESTGQSVNCCPKADSIPFSRASIWTSFPSSHKASFSYSHSFFITDNYVIFVEQPLLVNGLKLATCTPKGKAMTDCLEWHPNSPVRFHVIDKKTGLVSKVKYTTGAFFFFHTINSYEVQVNNEEDASKNRNYIILDIISYESPAVLEKYNISNMRSNLWDETCQPRAERYILPLDDLTGLPTGANLIDLPSTECTAVKVDNDHVSLRGELLGPQGFELPRINYRRCNGKPYRYIYGTGGFEKGFYSNSVCKLDINTKTPVLWKPESETAFAGEPVFVSHPDAVDEDDGVLLSVVVEVSRTPEKHHFLVILNAKTMQEIARAQFSPNDVQIPPSIHGTFVEQAHQ